MEPSWGELRSGLQGLIRGAVEPQVFRLPTVGLGFTSLSLSSSSSLHLDLMIGSKQPDVRRRRCTWFGCVWLHSQLSRIIPFGPTPTDPGFTFLMPDRQLSGSK